MNPPAGWYTDQGDQGRERWWDGQQWTEKTRPAAMPPPAQDRYAPAPAAAARNGFGIASLILGLIGVFTGFIPIMFWLAAPLGLTGLILGFAGRGRVKRREATNGKTTWAGVVISIGAIAMAIWGMTIVFDATEQLGEDLQEIEQQLDEDLEELEQDLEQTEP